MDPEYTRIPANSNCFSFPFSVQVSWVLLYLFAFTHAQTYFMSVQ